MVAQQHHSGTDAAEPSSIASSCDEGGTPSRCAVLKSCRMNSPGTVFMPAKHPFQDGLSWEGFMTSSSAVSLPLEDIYLKHIHLKLPEGQQVSEQAGR
jgi:hypothetical protein